MSDNASLKIWQTMQPMVRKEVSKGTESSVKSKKMVVTTAYNASTKTVGVTEAFGKEIQVPVAGMINPYRLLVGTSVWAIALHGNWSNAMVCMLGDGQIPPAVFAPVNLLDNSDFRNPVNQRGGTSHTASENTASYWLDRWQFGRGTAALVDGGLSIVWNGNTSYGTNTYFRQTLGTALDVGKTYTLAVKVDWQIEAYSFINPSDDAADLYFKTNAYRVQIDSNKRTFVFYNYTTTPKVFEWAALYEGEYTAETLPPYVPNGYAVELLECQRYFFPLDRGCLCFGSVNKWGSTFYGTIYTSVEMRTKPSISTTSNNYSLTNNGTQVDLTGTLTVQQMTGNNVQIMMDVTNKGMGAAMVTKLWLTDDSASAYLSADL